MCGLISIFYPKEARPINGLIPLDLLRHRGPDDSGRVAWRRENNTLVKTDPDAACHLWLGHTRLSIIDTSARGHQPMSSPDGRFTIALNGEIYNYLELKAELKRCGHQFYSDSDTEVLLAAWAQWGESALPRLIGMFSFCLVDLLTNQLYAVRDFFGIKPLFWRRENNLTAFSSELAPLLSFDSKQWSLNAQCVFDFIRWGLTEHKNESLIKGIERVPPGHLLEIDLTGRTQPSLRSYWSLPAAYDQKISLEDASDELRELFLDSIRLHLRSDVSIGFALSGGIDSSAIVAGARYVEPDLDLHTFSYIPDDPRISEEIWIDLVATHTCAKATKIRFDPAISATILKNLIRIQGEPFSSTSILAQADVYRSARREGITVMLDGQGGDELFAGYPYHISARIADLFIQGHPWCALHLARAAAQQGGPSTSILLQLMAEELSPQSVATVARRFTNRSLIPDWISDAAMNELGIEGQSWRNVETHSGSYLTRRMRQTITRANLPDLLRYQDRNSMAVSIEARVPFLTPKLAQFSLTLPQDLLVDGEGWSKAVFRHAMRGIVPEAILARRDKVGFETPEADWTPAFKPLLATCPGDNPVFQLVKRSEFTRVLEDTSEGRRPYHPMLWRVICLAFWVEQLRDDVGNPPTIYRDARAILS